MAQLANQLVPSDKPALAEHVPVLVIGGGQAGLAAGYQLKRRGVPFIILDAEARTGDAWRRRWDSLRLFTPARYDALAGVRFPGSQSAFPTKDEMADYLEAYAARFTLPIRHSVEVTRLERRGDRYVVSAGRQRFEAEHVVVATSACRVPRVPGYARDLASGVRQIHSSAYKTPADLQDGAVLVVGAGNSGAEIALELARRGRSVFLSGRDVGEVPFRIESFLAKVLLVPLVLRVVFHRMLSVATPVGRRVRAKSAGRGHALIRTKARDLSRAGVQRVARVRTVQRGLPVLEDGRTLDVANVVWCTGFDPGFSWIDLPVFGKDGDPVHSGGVVHDEPGLYFLGLPFLYAMSSIMIHGVSRDAARVASAIARRIH
jgi:putative flavoprotein involved in K+ transport